jgi:hypothetical protein
MDAHLAEAPNGNAGVVIKLGPSEAQRLSTDLQALVADYEPDQKG